MTTGSVTITWWTGDASNGSVYYQKEKDKTGETPPRIVTENQPSFVHRINLVNLTPNETYSYAVSGREGEYSFRTFPEEGTIRFVMYGDTREQLPVWNQSTHHALVAERIAAEQDIRFVVHTGDLVNDPDDPDEWNRFFAAAGPMMNHIPFYPVAGNHEGDSGILEDIFGLPPWYVIRCGDVWVVVLDSNPLPPQEISVQDEFANAILPERETWTFAAIHHPLYSADPNHPGGFLDVRKRWETIFMEWGVRAVFSAHVHAYEHVEQHGIHYFTLATGGAPSYALAPEKPEGYVTGLEDTLGYAVVTVDATNRSVIIEFVKVADVGGNTIRLYPPGTIHERVFLSRDTMDMGEWGRLGFPVIFTSQFGDRKFILLT
jgi:predicted phosphodiesterase